ncbi:hypothetical protein BU23DRAFT_300864 [Bimuria novae-zelandiae CBS 107.79]|uniref:Uncharacterized protein n=1 Tax=Bimuria novae-zelandiae CBS 107.79 TaxID=1447943 RepID=A0A6A5UR65_9PLEO|nr:hypothetical protein BU23DRAFT_300864 [Bimuria novae-zelandiae CBS 107.79]
MRGCARDCRFTWALWHAQARLALVNVVSCRDATTLGPHSSHGEYLRIVSRTRLHTACGMTVHPASMCTPRPESTVAGNSCHPKFPTRGHRGCNNGTADRMDVPRHLGKTCTHHHHLIPVVANLLTIPLRTFRLHATSQFKSLQEQLQHVASSWRKMSSGINNLTSSMPYNLLYLLMRYRSRKPPRPRRSPRRNIRGPCVPVSTATSPVINDISCHNLVDATALTASVLSRHNISNLVGGTAFPR